MDGKFPPNQQAIVEEATPLIYLHSKISSILNSSTIFLYYLFRMDYKFYLLVLGLQILLMNALLFEFLPLSFIFFIIYHFYIDSKHINNIPSS